MKFPISANNSVYGVTLSVSASALFAAMPVYVGTLPEIPGYALLAQRVLWSVLIMLTGMTMTGQLKEALSFLMSVRAFLQLVFTSTIIGFQMWLFIWAPLNGRALELSLGYFLLPLVMVGVGKMVFKETLRPIQLLALVCAIIGVGAAYVKAGGLSWVVLTIALGFPFYYLVRRQQKLSPLPAFFLENLLLLPFAMWAILHVGQVSHPFAFPGNELAGFIGLALLGTVPVLCMLAAGRILSFSLFGLLSYLEPALIFLVTLFILKERVPQDEMLTYGAVLGAVGFLALDGLYKCVQDFLHTK